MKFKGRQGTIFDIKKEPDGSVTLLITRSLFSLTWTLAVNSKREEILLKWNGRQLKISQDDFEEFYSKPMTYILGDPFLDTFRQYSTDFGIWNFGFGKKGYEGLHDYVMDVRFYPTYNKLDYGLVFIIGYYSLGDVAISFKPEEKLHYFSIRDLFP